MYAPYYIHFILLLLLVNFKSSFFRDKLGVETIIKLFIKYIYIISFMQFKCLYINQLININI